jgi:hypothetical protein
MLVKMRTQIGGTRNGVPWPARGGLIDVPPHEAADLIAAGYAQEAESGQDAPPADPPAEVADAGDQAADVSRRRRKAG